MILDTISGLRGRATEKERLEDSVAATYSSPRDFESRFVA